SPSMAIQPVSFQIYFPRENKRFIYNNRLSKFILEEKTILNDKELNVLKFTALGKREYEIAEAMGVDIGLVKYYKKSVLKKLSVYSMPEALYYALKQNLI
ncbi:MAG: response regulator transcription factor, partial [Tannerellaceae bacterium]